MRDYDPTTGRYLQADPLGLVDGASVYGYALGNPGRWTDPRGETVYVVCRPLAGVGAALAGYVSHCAIFIVNSTCTCSGDAQFSMGGGDTVFNGSPGVSSRDLRAFMQKSALYDGISKKIVEPPFGMTDCEYEYILIGIMNDYKQGNYHAVPGENSNTGVNNGLEQSGVTPPYMPGAVGQYWDRPDYYTPLPPPPPPSYEDMMTAP